MYIVCSKKSEKANGQICNTVFQVTADPPIIAFSINKTNLTHEYLEESKLFSLSILSKETPLKFIGLFGFRSGREVDKMKNAVHKPGATGVPIVTEYAVAYLEGEVINRVEVGNYYMYLGKVVEAELLTEAEPMTYAYYHGIVHGVLPKTAPIYIGKDLKEEAL